MVDGSANTPPGWYYAAGDPPGTHRYWDGTTWQGGPQPVAGAAPGDIGTMGGGGQKAELGARFVAFLIDAGILLAGYIVIFIVGAIFGAISDSLGGIVIVLGIIGIFGFSIWNWVVRQGQTGQSIGKAQQGIALLDNAGQPVGAGNAFIRLFVGGIIDNICYINTLWIFFDKDNQRLADKIINANVYAK